MSDVVQKTENNTETVVNGAIADDGKAIQHVASNENAAGDEKKQKKKKPNNKSKSLSEMWLSEMWRHPIRNKNEVTEKKNMFFIFSEPKAEVKSNDETSNDALEPSAAAAVTTVAAVAAVATEDVNEDDASGDEDEGNAEKSNDKSKSLNLFCLFCLHFMIFTYISRQLRCM